MKQSSIGLTGLAVMGQNLARNIASKGFSIVVHNRTATVTADFITKYGTELLTAAGTLEEFVAAIERPRKILLMVKAGEPVDDVIAQLVPLLEAGDLIVDCGNSNYRDTIRRTLELAEHGILFSGTGVSGGEEGALNGPSIMPGGTAETWEMLSPVFTRIAAKDFSGGACVTHIGPDGAGHYVKMVHNGIEYAVMQAIAEIYWLMHTLYNKSAAGIADVFAAYNEGSLASYLIEITAEVLRKKDDLTGGYLIDSILDKAGQKGTGAWTVIDALERGTTLTVIAEAVFARTLSAQKDLRMSLDGFIDVTAPDLPDFETFTAMAESALINAMYVSYTQGYELIRTAAAEHNWQIDLSEISRIWQGGCIIRARLLETLTDAFKTNSNTMLLDIDALRTTIIEHTPALRAVAVLALSAGIHVPVLTSSLLYLDGVSSGRLSANMIQGLRDYFGAHTYERSDREGTFHTVWSE